MSEDLAKYGRRRGGVRANSGRKPVGGKIRNHDLHFTTTLRTYLWFHALAASMGSYGAALESLCEKELGPEGPTNDQ